MAQQHAGASVFRPVYAFIAIFVNHRFRFSRLRVCLQSGPGKQGRYLLPVVGLSVSRHHTLVEVDDDIAVHMTALVASAIDVAAQQTTVFIIARIICTYRHKAICLLIIVVA